MKNPRTSVLSRIIFKKINRKNLQILVVGCGSGIEASVLATDLSSTVWGIDLIDNFNDVAKKNAHLHVGDATNITFEDNYFDVVYSYHALEHIPNYHAALSEMHRVLKEDGLLCVGTPNRARLLGCFGGDSTIKDKILWNISDYKMKFIGKFKNEFGAHAGYTDTELESILLSHFSNIENITTSYYTNLYNNFYLAIKMLEKLRLSNFLFPSVYFLGCK